jgi:putative ABC transport system permease protein
MTSIHRRDFNSVLARAANFETFRRWLAGNPTLHVFTMRQADWNAKSSGGFTNFLTVIVYGVGVILATGALFGCFNTMYAAVAARGREIATLRALGYGSFAVASSVVLEAAALSVAGALIGALYAWARYNDVETGFGNSVFKLMVSPAMVGTIILWAIAVALLGGILPSIRAAKRPVADALRAT